MSIEAANLMNSAKTHKKVCVDVDINNTKALKALDEIQVKARETFQIIDKLTKKINQLNTSMGDNDDSADSESKK